jgi:outer membrane immunogenic protein
MGWLMTSVASGAPSAISGAPHGRHRDSSRRGRGPRAGLAALALILLAPAGAVAADMPDFLRGSFSPSTTRWDGFYFGAQAGKTFGSADFSSATGSMVSYILANTELQSLVSDWTTLSKGSTGSQSFGGFIGYNFQWDDVVLGGELNYNRMSLETGARDTVGPILVPGHNLPDGSTVLYSITETSSASVAIRDIVTARARAGWAFDRFLPYGFAGLAVGRADVARFASVTGTKSTQAPNIIDPITGGVIIFAPVVGNLNLPRNPQSQSQGGVIAYGFTAGLGVEVAVVQNLFVRAEWEFVEFPNISDIRVQANSVRAAVGLKF